MQIYYIFFPVVWIILPNKEVCDYLLLFLFVLSVFLLFIFFFLSFFSFFVLFCSSFIRLFFIALFVCIFTKIAALVLNFVNIYHPGWYAVCLSISLSLSLSHFGIIFYLSVLFLIFFYVWLVLVVCHSHKLFVFDLSIKAFLSSGNKRQLLLA